MATLGLLAFAGLMPAQFLSIVYAARYGAPVEVRADRRFRRQP